MSQHFREVQRPRQWWVAGIIIGVAALQWIGFVVQIVLGRPFGDEPAPDWMVVLFWLIFGILFPVGWWSSRLVVELRDDGVHVIYVPFLHRTIPYDTITGVQAITYKPVREFGGWGIRWWFNRDRMAYSVSGNQGVEVQLADQRTVVIGSQQPEALAAAIQARL